MLIGKVLPIGPQREQVNVYRLVPMFTD